MKHIVRTYNLFKPDFKFETYLEVVIDGRFRHALTKFRTGSHTLEISLWCPNIFKNDGHMNLIRLFHLYELFSPEAP